MVALGRERAGRRRAKRPAVVVPEINRRFEKLARERQEASRAENRKRDANGRVVPASAILRAPVPDPRKAAADTAAALGISARTVSHALHLA